jgi:hypothetical protein
MSISTHRVGGIESDLHVAPAGVMDGITDAITTSATMNRRPSMTNITTRRCVGSTRFGIDPHEAPAEDFPKQPSQPDGLGRMCREHWKTHTAGLRRDAQASKVNEANRG